MCSLCAELIDRLCCACERDTGKESRQVVIGRDNLSTLVGPASGRSTLTVTVACKEITVHLVPDCPVSFGLP